MQRVRAREEARRYVDALCADAGQSAWYEINLHLLRHGQTIIGCFAMLRDRRGHEIRVPRVSYGPKRFLILDPLGGIHAGDLWMQPGRDVRVVWKLPPAYGLTDMHRVARFTDLTCRTIGPDQVPT